MRHNAVKVTYDFAVGGGAIGDVALDKFLPKNAYVTRVIAEELTDVVAGAGGTITLKCGATALTGAIGYASFTGITAPTLASSAGAVKVAASSELKVTIATGAVTAGKVAFIVEYII